MPAHTTTPNAAGSRPQHLTVAGQSPDQPTTQLPGQLPAQRDNAARGPAQTRADLDRLLQVRTQLARLVAERRSHRMDDELEVFGQQLAVEGAIRNLDRHTYDERWPHWVEAEVALEHEPATLVPWCTYCRSIAERSGINLLRPQPGEDGGPTEAGRHHVGFALDTAAA